VLDLFYPPKPPKPEGVSFVRNLMGKSNDYVSGKAPRMTRAQYLECERIRNQMRRRK
jgi:hypothetical protein